MLAGMARLAVAAPRRIVAAAVLLLIGAAAFGIPAASSLSAGGFLDPSSESARASAMLANTFHQGDMDLVVLVESQSGATAGAARTVGNRDQPRARGFTVRINRHQPFRTAANRHQER